MAEPLPTGIDAGSAAADAYEIAAALMRELIPSPLLVADFVFEILVIAGVIPDPMSLIAGLFGGRATMQATYDEATQFMSRKSPALKLLGVGAAQALHKSIPLSSPDVDPIFGPYFSAAVTVENAIRWARQDASVQSADTATLAAAMHEAGNPGVAGTSTLDAIENAWHALASLPANQQALADLSHWTGPGPAGDLVRGIGTTYQTKLRPGGPAGGGGTEITAQQALNQITSYTAADKAYLEMHQPAGTHTLGQWETIFQGMLALLHQQPPPPPPTGANLTAQQALNIITSYTAADTAYLEAHQPAGTHTLGEWETIFQEMLTALHTVHDNPSITLGQQYGAQVSGIVILRAQLSGGEYPTAHANFLVDGQLIGQVPAETTSTSQVLNISTQWDSRTVKNGLHVLVVQWQGIRGYIQFQAATRIDVENGIAPPPPPPPPPEVPLTLPWFDPCQEAINCHNLTEDGLMVGQMLANIAKAALSWPVALAAMLDGKASEQIPLELERIVGGLNALTRAIPPAADFSTLNAEVKCLCTELTAIAGAVAAVNVDTKPLAAAVAALMPPLRTIAEKIQPVDLSKVVAELKRRNDDLQVHPDWKKALIDSKSLPPELAALLQSTIWDTVSAATGSALGHVLGWGEAEIVGTAEKIGRYFISPVIHFVGILWKEFLVGFNPEGGPAAADFERAVKALVKYIDEIVTGVFGFVANTAVEAYEAGVAGIDTSNAAGVEAATKLLLGRALEMGTSAHLIANLAELVPFTKNIGLNQTAAFVAELAGFREVLVNTHRPFLYSKLGRPAGYVFNRKFPTALPAAAAGFGMWSRRILSDQDAEHLASSAGLATHWQTPMFRAAYRPVSPRALTTLMQDQPFDAKQMRQILEDNGWSPAHVAFMLAELEYASTKNVRNSYINEAITAYQHGVMPDQELDEILTGVGWSNEAKKFVHERALLARRVTLAGKVEAQIIGLVAQGLLSPEVGHQHMEAAGIQPWYANLEITLATTKAELHAAKLEATAEARAEHERQRNQTKAAVAEYHAGRLDTAELAVALRLAGLDASLIASIVALNEALRAGRLKLTYGQLLTPEASAVLHEQVAAIEQQAKDQLVPIAAVTAQLRNLKIPNPEINALIARWGASLKKSPGAAVLINPLTGAHETAIS